MKKIFLTFASLAIATIMASAADKPQFPGGKEALDNYIKTNMVYPQTAKDNGVEGVVAVQFIVTTDGTPGTIKIVRMVDPDLEQEAIRLVKKMPAWIPADKDGTPVESTAEIDIPFVLE